MQVSDSELSSLTPIFSLDRQCGKGMFSCKNSLCIPETFRCDGQDDCIDGSDEVMCGKIITNLSIIMYKPLVFKCGCIFTSFIAVNHTCLPDRFRCSNSKCIPVVLLCDGNDDCGDNSDENKRNCPNRCKDGSFQCADGKIPV